LSKTAQVAIARGIAETPVGIGAALRVEGGVVGAIF
jgi:hypothetical protein